MKIVNPNWHPESPSQLTTSQYRNLKRLLEDKVTVKRNTKESKSFDSLVRHNLADVSAHANMGVNVYYPSKLAWEWRDKGYITGE